MRSSRDWLRRRVQGEPPDSVGRSIIGKYEGKSIIEAAGLDTQGCIPYNLTPEFTGPASASGTVYPRE